MWNRCAAHMPLQRTRRIPTAYPGRKARAALQIIGKICAMTCLLIGPKIWEARAAIGRVAGFLFLVAGRVGNSASVIQMTHVFRDLHGTVSHRNLQKLFPFGSKGEMGDTVEFTSCTDLHKAVGECVRAGSRSKSGSKVKDTDLN